MARFSSTGKPGKQLPMMTLPVALAPPSFSTTFWPRIRPLSTDRSPTYGALTAVIEQVELHDRGARVDDLVERARHRSPGTDVAMPWTPAATSAWTSAELRVGVAALGSRDLELDVQVGGRGVRAVDDLLDERVAQHVGHEPDLDRLRDRGSGRGHRGGRLADRGRARRRRRWGRGRATAVRRLRRAACRPQAVRARFGSSSSVPPTRVAARTAVSLHGPCSVHRSDQLPPLDAAASPLTPRSTTSRARRARWRRTSWSTATAMMIDGAGDERATT